MSKNTKKKLIQSDQDSAWKDILEVIYRSTLKMRNFQSHSARYPNHIAIPSLAWDSYSRGESRFSS